MTRLRAWMWQVVPGFHPGMESILEWADARAGSSSRAAGADLRAVAVHLARCRHCRETAARIGIALAGRVAKPAPAALHSAYEHLLVRMQAWSSLNGSVTAARAGKPRGEAASRHFNALEVYFGKGTADRIRRAVRRDASDRHIVPVVEPLFHAFLGRRAAEALARQIAG